MLIAYCILTTVHVFVVVCLIAVSVCPKADYPTAHPRTTITYAVCCAVFVYNCSHLFPLVRVNILSASPNTSGHADPPVQRVKKSQFHPFSGCLYSRPRHNLRHLNVIHFSGEPSVMCPLQFI